MNAHQRYHMRRAWAWAASAVLGIVAAIVALLVMPDVNGFEPRSIVALAATLAAAYSCYRAACEAHCACKAGQQP